MTIHFRFPQNGPSKAVWGIFLFLMQRYKIFMTLAIKSLDLFELICDYPYVIFLKVLTQAIPDWFQANWAYISRGVIFQNIAQPPFLNLLQPQNTNSEENQKIIVHNAQDSSHHIPFSVHVCVLIMVSLILLLSFLSKSFLSFSIFDEISQDLVISH